MEYIGKKFYMTVAATALAVVAAKAGGLDKVVVDLLNQPAPVVRGVQADDISPKYAKLKEKLQERYPGEPFDSACHQELLYLHSGFRFDQD